MGRRVFFVNFFGGLGYMSCLLQWIWTLIFYLPSILNSHVIESFLPAKQPTPVVSTPVTGPPSPVLIGVAVAVTALVTIFTIYALIKIPVTVARAGKKVTHEAAELAVPVLTHHQKLPIKNRRLLTARLTRLMKLVLIIIPLITVLFVPRADLPISFDIILFTSSALALGSAIWFSLQLVAARLAHVSDSQVF